MLRRNLPPTDWSRLSRQVLPGIDHLHAQFTARTYERHAHDDAVVIGLIERGEQRSSYGRGTYRAGAGTIVLIGAGVPHDGGPAAADGFVYRSLHIDRTLARDLFEDVAGTRIDEVALVDPVIEHAASFRALRRFCRTATDPGCGPSDREAALLSAVAGLVRAARFSAPAGERKAGSEPRLVAAAREYIHACLARQGLCVSHVAAHCGTTRAHLTRAFRKVTGLPPHTYLNLQRIEQARRRIVSGEPTAEVAAATGFTDQSHLIRRFRGVYGVTPGQFARRH